MHLLEVIAPAYTQPCKIAGAWVSGCRRAHFRSLDRISFTLANALVGNARENACVGNPAAGRDAQVVADSVRVALVGSNTEYRRAFQRGE